MKKHKFFGISLRAGVLLALCAVAAVAQASGVDVAAFATQHIGSIAGVSALGFVGETEGPS